MTTLVIGDLHGQWEIAQSALDTGLPVVFLGDYLDSYTRSTADQLKLLDIVLDAVEQGRAEALLGNHEHSYLTERMRCSGFDPIRHHIIALDYKERMLSLLKPYTWCEGFLLSHAGVSNELLSNLKLTLEEYLAAGEFLQIGRSRGGYSYSGGLFWADFNMDFTPVHGVKQIVGHTRGKDIREKDGNYCIDILEDSEPKVALIDNGKIEFIDL